VYVEVATQQKSYYYHVWRNIMLYIYNMLSKSRTLHKPANLRNAIVISDQVQMIILFQGMLLSERWV